MDAVRGTLLSFIIFICLNSAATSGVCFDTKKEKRTKVVLQRKSYIGYEVRVCREESGFFCRRSKTHFREEFVPQEYEEEINVPYCCPGFKNSTEFTNITSVMAAYVGYSYVRLGCDPVCEPPCLNGLCTAPNTCECPPGTFLDKDKRTCINNCDSPCHNGECIEHKCVCHKNYYLSEVGLFSICVPICEPSCVNSHCIAPNICNCKSGYSKENSEFLNICLPVCEPPCVGGECKGPNKCECFDGYNKSLNNDYTCDPYCKSCTNGACIKPNLCQCNEGYYLDNPEQDNEVGSCKPECNPECENGVCISPDVCDCVDGYQKNSFMSNLCEPACSPSCINGDCTSPNECTCHEGYIKSNGSKELCLPLCDNCENGVCIAPGVCMCSKGYIMDDDNSVCIPQCIPPCYNGNCTRPDYCECNEGFYKVDTIEGVTHLCDSKVKRCKKNIKNRIRSITNTSCFEFDQIVSTYDELCQIEMTNDTCYTEYCESDSNQDRVCNMVYTCELIPDLMNPPFSAICSWNYGNDVSQDAKITNEPAESKNNSELILAVTEHYYRNGSSSEFMTTEKTIPILHNDDMQLLQSLHFFKPNFDESPCLLCLCLVKDERQSCLNEKVHFKLCQCPIRESATYILAVDKSLHLITVCALFTLLLLSIVTVLFVARKYSMIHKRNHEFKVRAFTNPNYGETTLQETEHIYTEILGGNENCEGSSCVY